MELLVVIRITTAEIHSRKDRRLPEVGCWMPTSRDSRYFSWKRPVGVATVGVARLLLTSRSELLLFNRVRVDPHMRTNLLDLRNRL